MTEHDHSAEYVAHAAIADYVNVGPGPNFGELEVSALDSWIDDAEKAPRKLAPVETTNVAWMHAERAWSRITEGGFLGEEPPQDIAKTVRRDLMIAQRLFRSARDDAGLSLRAHIDTAAMSMSLLDPILTTPYSHVSASATAGYLMAQYAGNLFCLNDFKQQGAQPSHVPALDTSLGLRLLTSNFLTTSYAPLIASYRHSQAGPPTARWQVALHERNSGATHKVRIGPYGPPEMILLPPSLFGHADIPTDHSRGMLEAVVTVDAWGADQRRRVKAGQEPVISGQILDYRRKILALDERIEAHLGTELERINIVPRPEYVPPEDPVSWYEGLSPFADPCHESHGGALELAISKLELQRSSEERSLDVDYLLGWMHMESGSSVQAMDTAAEGMLIGSFERAEDLFAQARDAMPESLRRTSRYFELAMAEASAPLYAALIAQENISERIDIYCGQLAILAPQILDAYHRSDTTSDEAAALSHLLHLISACLLASHTPDKTFVALPSSPRQRGSYGDIRGHDFSFWMFDSEDTYVLGQFSGRLEEAEDPYSVDSGVVTIGNKKVGSQDFKALRAVVEVIAPSASRKPDHKAINKARGHVLKLAPKD